MMSWSVVLAAYVVLCCSALYMFLYVAVHYVLPCYGGCFFLYCVLLRCVSLCMMHAACMHVGTTVVYVRMYACTYRCICLYVCAHA